MKLNKKYLLVIISIAGTIFLTACHDGGNSTGSASTSISIFGDGCSGSFSEQIECYAHQYLADKSALDKTKEKCINMIDSAKHADCEAFSIVMRAPGAIKWLNKPEPYPNKPNFQFFRDTSDQIRIDERGWCVAQTYIKHVENSQISKSCYSLNDFIMRGGDSDVEAKILKIGLSMKKYSN